MFDSRRWSDAEEEVDGVIELTGTFEAARILDLGCGPGRHSLELARRGHAVTGIDLHEPYLRDARERARKTVPDNIPEFRREDMRKIRYGKSFDGAISLFQSIGYTEDESDDLDICRGVCGSLKEGGWFLIETDGKEATAAAFEERTWMERDGRIILLEYAAEAAWTRLHNRWMFRDADGSWKECEFSYRLYSALEMGRLLETAGFASIEFFGGLDGRPYDHNAHRLVALARRP